jgi:hypothetical protein
MVEKIRMLREKEMKDKERIKKEVMKEMMKKISIKRERKGVKYS